MKNILQMAEAIGSDGGDRAGVFGLEAIPRPVAGELHKMEQRIDALVLANLAMWSILREKLGVTDEELEARVKELDLADGQQDGKLRVGPRMCEKCKRPNSPRWRKCLYCGHAFAASTPFPM
jgi:hypothetical protein